MSARCLALVLLSVALVPACGGGGKKVSAARSPGGEGDDPATPFSDAAVKATLRGMAGDTTCGLEAGTTLGARLDREKDALRGDGIVIDESFRCRARADDLWDCEWAVSARPAAAAAAEPCGDSAEPCGATAEPCGDDPCGGEGPSFIIMATVRPDGRVAPNDVHCVAPG